MLEFGVWCAGLSEAVQKVYGKSWKVLEGSSSIAAGMSGSYGQRMDGGSSWGTLWKASLPWIKR